jgi:hypothetical protein
MQAVYPHPRNAWARDQTSFNPSKTKFVAAFNIYEHTMMNEMGRIVWGRLAEESVQVVGQMHQHLAYCWEQPFANWIDDNCFVVKINGGSQQYPLLAIDFRKGFQKISGSDNLKSRASQVGKKDISEKWSSDQEGVQR